MAASDCPSHGLRISADNRFFTPVVLRAHANFGDVAIVYRNVPGIGTGERFSLVGNKYERNSDFQLADSVQGIRQMTLAG